MLDYQWAINEYKKLDYSAQKTRLMTLFEIFQEHSQSIPQMITLLQSDQMTSSDMVQAYSDLSSAISMIDKKDLEAVFSKMDKLKIKIDEIRKQEEEDRKTENTEDLLKNI